MAADPAHPGKRLEDIIDELIATFGTEENLLRLGNECGMPWMWWHWHEATSVSNCELCAMLDDGEPPILYFGPSGATFPESFFELTRDEREIVWRACIAWLKRPEVWPLLRWETSMEDRFEFVEQLRVKEQEQDRRALAEWRQEMAQALHEQRPSPGGWSRSEHEPDGA